jgi:hypothetical protein
MTDKINNIWDRADFAANALWCEMDDLLQEMEGAPVEARGEFKARFMELQKRISERALSIYDNAAAGNPAPHLKIVE